jgi:hypothetical protein
MEIQVSYIGEIFVFMYAACEVGNRTSLVY